MLRNYFVINLIFLIIIALLGVRFYRAWMKPLDVPTDATIKQVQEGEKVREDKKLTEKQKAPFNMTYYDVIVLKDLFQPSRSASEFKSGNSGTMGTAAPGNRPILFGTIIMGSEKSAILEDPSTKTTKLYRVNDRLAGFTITDIQKDKVILLSGGRLIEVKLREIKNIPPSRIQQQPSTSSRTFSKRSLARQRQKTFQRHPPRRRAKPPAVPVFPQPKDDKIQPSDNLPEIDMEESTRTEMSDAQEGE